MNAEKYFKRLDPKILKALQRIAKVIESQDCQAYVVGGFVRDLFLKRPNGDVDIVIEADATQLAAKLAAMLKARHQVYREFLTATVHHSTLGRIDLASARKEKYPQPGVLPVVSLGTIDDDLARRDFSFNAMAISITPSSFGLLKDNHGGVRDLKDGRIRILHNRSFIDDPTRILRAVRFEQRFGFRLERKTCDLLKKAIHQQVYKTVKPQRYFEEFKKILKEKDCCRCLKRLDQLRALTFLDKDLKWKKAHSTLCQSTDRNKQLFERYCQKQEISNRPLKRWLMMLMVLMYHFPLKKIRLLAYKFALSRADTKTLSQIKKFDRLKSILSRSDCSAFEVYQSLHDLDVEVILFFKSLASQKRMRKNIGYFLKNIRDIRLSISGNDLIQMGCAPGRRLGLILRHVLTKKIQNPAMSHAQEIKMAKDFIKE